MRRLQGHIHAAIQAAIPCLGEEPERAKATTAETGMIRAPMIEAGAQPLSGYDPGTPALASTASGDLPPEGSDRQWLLAGGAGLAKRIDQLREAGGPCLPIGSVAFTCSWWPPVSRPVTL